MISHTLSRFLLTAAIVVLPFLSTAQAPAVKEASSQAPAVKETLKTASENLIREIQSYPQEKIYLHTDKPYYSASDTIWYKAYMVHAALHQSIEYSRYIYVELVNSSNQVITRQRVRPEEGRYYCQMPLSPALTPGYYSLRAYTNYMRNLDEAYFFRRELYIGNGIQTGQDTEVQSLTTGSSPSGRPQNVDPSEEGDAPAFDLQFLPEGGHLLAGVPQTVAFKAIDTEGWGQTVHGSLLDGEGREILRFEDSHLGMGRFVLVAEKGQTYQAVCEDDLGNERRITLPAATDSTYALAYTRRGRQHLISVNCPYDQGLSDTLGLLIHLRGVPLFSSQLTPDRSFMALPMESLPAGVLGAVLINRQGETLSQRLFFNQNGQKPVVEASFDKASYGRRERVTGQFKLSYADGRPLDGHYSVSVTDDGCIERDPNDLSIESYLLLCSDLKGYIEKPGAYFAEGNTQAADWLDLLMLTQGWSRYDLPSIIKNGLQALDTYELEVGSVLCGRLQTYPIRRAIPGVNISVFNAMHAYMDAVVTDNRGRFCIEGFEFPDSSSFFLQADKKSSGTIMELTAEEQSYPKVGLSLPYFTQEKADHLTMQRFLLNSRDRYFLESGEMMINLGEISISAKKTESLRQERGALYPWASYSFSAQDIDDLGSVSLLDLLLQAPGITLNSSGDGVLLRNQTPAIYVDNLPYSMEDLRTIIPEDVELIDILKEPSQTMFYQGGANGVIAIYLKRVRDREAAPLGSHQKIVPYLGYTTPKTCYQPMYSVERRRNDPTPDLRSTLLWEPNVTPDAEGRVTLRFYTADQVGTYSLVLEGISAEGETLHFRTTIRRN